VENAAGFSPFSPQLIFGPSGDFNLNGKVDAADYVRWRKTSGHPVEYDMWRENFGRTFSGSGTNSAAAPEPTALLFAILAAALALARRTKRRPLNTDRW
jgi:MYXO-CTERM domain-containing protein